MNYSENKKDFPSYLHELIEDKPSSKLKLLAAWDGLSTETQIKILDYFSDKPLTYLKDKILTSNNDYVKYLIGQHIHFDANNELDKKIIAVLNSSENPLVKFIPQQCNVREAAKNPATFFSMPHNERLAFIDNACCGHGEAHEFTSLLEFAIDNNAAPEKELADLTLEYLKNLKKSYQHVENLRQYNWHPAENLNDIRAFLQVVIKVPKGKNKPWASNLSKTILYNMPINESELNNEKREWEHLLLNLDHDYLITFLSRWDVACGEIREKIFFDKSLDKKLRLEAAANLYSPLRINAVKLQEIKTENDEIFNKLIEAIAKLKSQNNIAFVWRDESGWSYDGAGHFIIDSWEYWKEYRLPNQKTKESTIENIYEELQTINDKTEDIHDFFSKVDKIHTVTEAIKWFAIGSLALLIIEKFIHWL